MSAVQYIPATVHISSISNLRTRHAVMITDQPNILTFIGTESWELLEQKQAKTANTWYDDDF
jgi:hypothetical protein